MQSLAHPGGNATGVISNLGVVGVKGIDVLRQCVPSVSRVAHLANLSNPGIAAAAQFTAQSLTAVGIQVLSLDVRTLPDVGPAFDAMTRWNAQALVGVTGALFDDDTLQRIIQLAVAGGLPAVYTNGDDRPARLGGLMAYFIAADLQFRRAAYLVDRILRGTQPADLPVEQVDTFSLAVNRATMTTLGISMPPDVIQQVTEWIT